MNFTGVYRIFLEKLAHGLKALSSAFCVTKIDPRQTIKSEIKDASTNVINYRASALASFQSLPSQNSTASGTFWLLKISINHFPNVVFRKANPSHSVANTQLSNESLALWEQHMQLNDPQFMSYPDAL